MSKAGKGDSVDTGSVGSQHPVPEDIPHLSSPANGASGITGMLHPQHHSNLQAGSPVKESSFLNQETSAEELDGAQAVAGNASATAGAAVRFPTTTDGQRGSDGEARPTAS